MDINDLIGVDEIAAKLSENDGEENSDKED